MGDAVAQEVEEIDTPEAADDQFTSGGGADTTNTSKTTVSKA